MSTTKKKPDLSAITADEFIRALMPRETIDHADMHEGDEITIVSNPFKPADAPDPLWPPVAYHSGASYASDLYLNWATVHVVEYTDSKGRTKIGPRATNAAFAQMHFLMLDDIGTKAQLTPKVLKGATYILETSKGNFQAGFALALPIDATQTAQLLRACFDAKLGDEGCLKSSHRWCRVPGSENKKPGKGGWRARLTQWNPGKRYTLKELCKLLGLKLDESIRATESRSVAMPDDVAKYNDRYFKWMQTLERGAPGSICGPRRSTGFFPVICPWGDEHSSTIDGAAYKPGYKDDPPAFRCQHSHGDKYKTREFIEWAAGEMGNPVPQRVDASVQAATPSSSDPGFSLASLHGRTVKETPWIIRGLAAPGAMLLVGRPKGGKSLLSTDMVYAVASGKPFLGRETTRSEVLWLAAEDDKDSLTRRIQKRSTPPPDGVHVYTGEELRAERALWNDCSLLGWIGEFVKAHPKVRMVIVDTHATCEAVWEGDDKEDRGSVVLNAYKKARVYQELGLDLGVCIVLVHHTRKTKSGREVNDYHELINMPQTIVAGVTTSAVIADHPDRDVFQDDPRRVWATRCRHAPDCAEQITMQEDLTFKLDGLFYEVRQTEVQAEIMAAVEALQEGDAFVTSQQIAEEIDTSKNNVKRQLGQMKRSKDPGRMVWKGRKIEIKQGRSGGIRLV